MDTELKCNRLTCRRVLTDKAVVVSPDSCSYYCIIESARRLVSCIKTKHGKKLHHFVSQARIYFAVRSPPCQLSKPFLLKNSPRSGMRDGTFQRITIVPRYVHY
jgi:hypothetical protein